MQDIPFEEVRSIALPPSSKLTENLIQQLHDVFEFASPGGYRDTLIEIYNTYILHRHDDLPANFQEMAEHLCVLFEFLKIAQDEMNP